MILEIWKPVSGYEGRYEVSSLGRIRSTSFRRTGVPRLLAQSKDSWGYQSVSLYDGSGRETRKTMCVHVIVAAAFLEPKLAGTEINHRDGDKTNNDCGNLGYVTAIENMRHSLANGLHGRARLNEERASAMRSLHVSGVPTKELARRFLVHRTSVQRVISGKTWQFCQKGG